MISIEKLAYRNSTMTAETAEHGMKWETKPVGDHAELSLVGHDPAYTEQFFPLFPITFTDHGMLVK